MITTQKITPFLWFDGQAEEAAEFYVSIFKNSRIIRKSYNTEATPGETGSVLVVTFELEGLQFVALNGGPEFRFTEAVSFQIDCESQEEVDYFWEKLSAGGRISQCGWLADKFGLSWQVTPRVLMELIRDSDTEKANRVLAAMMQMQKLDIPTLEAAARQG